LHQQGDGRQGSKQVLPQVASPRDGAGHAGHQGLLAHRDRARRAQGQVEDRFMGQKTHPYGFRLGVIKTWSSKWYESGSAYQKWLHQDIRIKRAIKAYLYNANIASVEIERAANRAK